MYLLQFWNVSNPFMMDWLSGEVLLLGVVRVVRNVDKKEIPLSQIQWTESENEKLHPEIQNWQCPRLFSRMPLKLSAGQIGNL